MTPSEKGKAALIKHLEKSGTGKEKLAIAEAAVVKDEGGERAGALCTIEYMKANGVNPITIAKAEKYVKDRDASTTEDADVPGLPQWPAADQKIADKEDKEAEKEAAKLKSQARKTRLDELHNMEPGQLAKLVEELKIELPNNAGKAKVANAIADAEEAKAEAAALHPPGSASR
jgi:hypothetical protein